MQKCVGSASGAYKFLRGYQRLISALIEWSLRLVADSVASRGGGMVIGALTIKDRHMRFKRHHSALGLSDIILVKSNMLIW